MSVDIKLSFVTVIRVDKARVAYEKALDLATRLGVREEMSRLKNKLQKLDEQLT